MRKVATLVGLTVFALAGSAFAQDSSGRIFSGSRPEAAPAADTAAPAPAADPAAAPVGDPAAAPAPAPEAAPAPVAAGTSYTTRGLTQTAGNLQVTVPIVLNLSKEQVLKPVWVPLDIRYGITDQLEVFLSHNYTGTPLAFGQGGVCLGGKDRFCDKLYNNLNVGAQFSLMKDAAIEISGIGAVEVRSLDPMHLAVDLGIGFKYVGGPVAIKAAPQIGIAATKRDEQAFKEFIAVPLQVAFQATPELALFLDTGIFSPTKDFSKQYAVPVGIGAAFAVMPNLDVGGEFMLPAILTGIEGDKAFDMRTLMVFAQYRLK